MVKDTTEQEEPKAFLTADRIDSDKQTYASITAGQYCMEPLIPYENPIEQLKWNVTFEPGAIYSPKKDVGIFANKVVIKFGCLINGSIYGRHSVKLQSGATKLGPGLINGSVTSKGPITISNPRTGAKGYRPDKIVIIGDIIGNSVEVYGNTSIIGNVIAKKDISIKGESSIQGMVYSHEGNIEIKNSSCYSIIAGNKIELDSSHGDIDLQKELLDILDKKRDVSSIIAHIAGLYRSGESKPSSEDIRKALDGLEKSGAISVTEIAAEGKKNQNWIKKTPLQIGPGVSVIFPVAWVRRGTPKQIMDLIKIDKHVRYISSTCKECDRVSPNNKFLCHEYLKGTCNTCHMLFYNDIINKNKGAVLTNAWRTFAEYPANYENIMEIFNEQISIRKDEEFNRNIFEEYIGTGVGNIEQKITQHIDKRKYVDKRDQRTYKTKVEDLRGLSADALQVKEHEKQMGKLKKEREKSERELSMQKAEIRAKRQDKIMKMEMEKRGTEDNTKKKDKNKKEVFEIFGK